LIENKFEFPTSHRKAQNIFGTKVQELLSIENKKYEAESLKLMRMEGGEYSV